MHHHQSSYTLHARGQTVITRWVFIVLAAFSLVSLLISATQADPITAITNLNNFRDTRGLNDVGIGQGDLIQFGANVVPNGTAGTTMQPAQGTTTLSAQPCIGLATSPNFCARTVPFSDGLRGAWTLTFRNGLDTAVATTPDLSLLPPAPSPPVPFPLSVTITGTGLQPTISFVVPGGFNPDAIRFQVFDKNARLANGQADVIHTEGAAGSVRSFTVPAVLSTGQTLQIGGSYALNVQLIDTRLDDIPFTNSNAQILRRSNSFFSFSPRTDGEQAAYLPTVGPDGVYRFVVGEVQAGVVVFLDPLVAVGYDYVIGPGNPNFESVVLPNIGDGIFTVRFSSNNAPREETVLAGQQFFFPPGGIAAFGVRAIEASAGLDPANVTAFITGLTFVADGTFTGTMTPVTQDVGSVASYTCSGFDHPFEQQVTLKRQVQRAIPLKIKMFTNGVPVTDANIVGAAPVVRVDFSPGGGTAAQASEELLQVGQSTAGNAFQFDQTSGLWTFNLGTRQFGAPGTYTVTTQAGDAAYVMAPQCSGQFVRLP
jgi:hypothetical protein